MRKKTIMTTTSAILFSTLCIAVLTIFVEADATAPGLQSFADHSFASISFPTSKTYDTNNVTLRFHNEKVASLFWDDSGPVINYSNIAYFLDGRKLGEVTPVIVNCRWSHAVNLTMLADGQHSVEVRGTVTATKDLYFCAVDAKQGDSCDFSDMVTFAVKTTSTSSPALSPSPSPTTEPTPTPSTSVPEIPAWTLLPLAGAVVAAMLVCFKRRKSATVYSRRGLWGCFQYT